ncbi:hypothetical protein NPIL_309771 [Nephila pilipes]|uniref:DNA ligase ATP-dependent N-terminal domain-containing protein n=1 Tax=Nephila pilipes TaxID=299642 RepID=A0A8X6UIV6_NEPPI|nr:hypothetical protein NPIL_309771 [Nephila pilipes]
MSEKTDKIQIMFVVCREYEAKYIIRLLSGKLWIRLAEQSVLAAFVRAAVLIPPNQNYLPEIDIFCKNRNLNRNLLKRLLIVSKNTCKNKL